MDGAVFELAYDRMVLLIVVFDARSQQATSPLLAQKQQKGVEMKEIILSRLEILEGNNCYRRYLDL